jgi:hypothetical protein
MFERRRAFERCLGSPDVKPFMELSFSSGGIALQATCPCCGYPTLRRRSFYEICPICRWEDDGQDDPDFAPYPSYFLPDDVAGGPNGRYSLTEARSNFVRHRQMTRPSNDALTKEMAQERQLREALIVIYDSLLPEASAGALIEAFPAIVAANRSVYEALSVRARKRFTQLQRERQKRYDAAIEAVALHFGAAWEKVQTPSEGAIVIAGQRIAVTIQSTLRQFPAGDTPRLRFDRVAQTFSATIQSALSGYVPEHHALLLTISAPIRRASRTASELESRLRVLLSPTTPRRELLPGSLHGNRIGAELLTAASREAPKILVFVHNPDVEGRDLLNAAGSLLKVIWKAGDRGTSSSPAADRWLIIVDDEEPSIAEAYRAIYPQLHSLAFQKVLVVSQRVITDLTS